MRMGVLTQENCVSGNFSSKKHCNELEGIGEMVMD
jgi:hypothetical protein